MVEEAGAAQASAGLSQSPHADSLNAGHLAAPDSLTAATGGGAARAAGGLSLLTD